MLVERIESKGLAHYSYIIGIGTESVVIDPRRDCDIYIQKAYNAGMKIKYILETHRNEDYVIGSCELAAKTDAEIWHADAELDYQYGNPTKNKQVWNVGKCKIKAIHSPGHTPGSMSYLLYDPDGVPWMVFTGDALFAGDVGRVDLLGEDRMEELANLLYETLFEKILTLGDEVIVCPAHGSGSVCGSVISERTWTTIGIEKQHNPKLQANSREEFVDTVMEVLPRPPYFRRMEKWNLQGAPILGSLPMPKPLTPKEIEDFEDAVILDIRDTLSYAESHIPNSISVVSKLVPEYAGWFLPYNTPIVLIGDSNDTEEVVRYLLRIGYDNLAGFLSGGMLSWNLSGKESEKVVTYTAAEICSLLKSGQELWILDIRPDEEIESAGQITGSHQIELHDLPERMNQIPKDKQIYIMCGSGLRSMTAASLLQRERYNKISVLLGGMNAWNRFECE
jgi:hydroxyacylglutathione hydrolase